jgi:hypothetical protein
VAKARKAVEENEAENIQSYEPQEAESQEPEPLGYTAIEETFVRRQLAVKQKDGSLKAVYKAQTLAAFNEDVKTTTEALSKGEEAVYPEHLGKLTVTRYSADTLDGALRLAGGNEEVALGYFNRGWQIAETEVYRKMIESGEELPEGSYDLQAIVSQPKERRRGTPGTKLVSSIKAFADAQGFSLSQEELTKVLEVIKGFKSA